MTNGFTEKRVTKFPRPANGYALHWDEDTPGLGLRVTKGGARAYVFEKRVNGKSVRTTIGNVKSWKLGDAQVEARRLATLVDRKVDPRDEAKEKVQRMETDRMDAQRRELLIGDVWAIYIEARKSKWGERHARDHVALAHAGGEAKKRGKGLTKPGPLASFMTLSLSDLTPERISDWLKREVEKRPTSTAQAFRLLRAFTAWASERKEYAGAFPATVCASKDVRELVPKSEAKDDALEVEQLPAWFSSVRAIGNPVIAAYLQAVLLTGSRREEMLSLQWRDVDFQWGKMTIKDKVKRTRTIPLTPYVSLLLNALPRRNRWVFSSEGSADGRMNEPRIGHNAALECAGLPHLTVHGLRRSFGLLSEWLEIPSGIIAQIQGHRPSATVEKHYRPRPLDILRAKHSTLEAWILEKAGVAFTAPTAGKSRFGVVTADGTVQSAA